MTILEYINCLYIFTKCLLYFNTLVQQVISAISQIMKSVSLTHGVFGWDESLEFCTENSIPRRSKELSS